MAESNDVRLSLFAPPRITVDSSPRTASGETLLLRSSEKLAHHPVTVVHSLREHARLAPDQVLVAERHRDPSSGWRECGYGEAVAAADSIGQALLDRGLGPYRPLLVLSGTAWTTC
jgi:feruloyl-CoA synthase